MRHLAMIVLLCAGLGVAGCTEEPTPVAPSAPKAETKQVQKKSVESAPVVEAEEEQDVKPIYTYDPAGRRDPFQSLLNVRRAVDDNASVPLTPLQRFGIGQLNLVAIVLGKGEPRALVVAPDRKSYVLTKGVKVGENAGEVVDITLDAVLVEEKYYDFAGELKKSIREIKLPLPEGGK